MVLADQAAGSTLARALSKIHGTGLPVLPSECIQLHAHVVTLRLTVGNHAAFQAITNGRVGSPAIRAEALEIQTSRFRTRHVRNPTLAGGRPPRDYSQRERSVGSSGLPLRVGSRTQCTARENNRKAKLAARGLLACLPDYTKKKDERPK